MIEFSDVHFNYPGGPRLLAHVDLEIVDGEHIGLVGSNGSCKSTLAKLTNGLLVPSQGRVVVDGLDTARPENLALIRQRVGMVFQNPDNQIVGSIVEDDVAFGPENMGLETEAIQERVEWALSHTGLSELARRSPMTLSGGQKQRLAVAGVLAMRPSHMVLDEATAMLDPAGREELLQVARDLKVNQGITIIQITHLLEELLGADRIIAMDRGRIVFDGPRTEFFQDPSLLDRLGLDLPPLAQLYHELKQANLLGDLDDLRPRLLADAVADRAGLPSS